MDTPIVAGAAVYVGSVLGTLSGVLIGDLAKNRGRSGHATPDASNPYPYGVEPDPGNLPSDTDLDEMAGAWAREHGRPEVGGLVAEKLRLIRDLAARRQHERKW